MMNRKLRGVSSCPVKLGGMSWNLHYRKDSKLD